MTAKKEKAPTKGALTDTRSVEVVLSSKHIGPGDSVRDLMSVINYGATREEREKAAESLRTKCGPAGLVESPEKGSGGGELSYQDLQFLVDEAISAEHEDTGMLVLELIKLQKQGIGNDYYFNALKRVHRDAELEGVKKAAGGLLRAYYAEKYQ